MKISSKLQDQIYFLCSKVPNLEWSGVLFYTTEGAFGEDSFKITCEEVFPLDIGSSGYTEYETDDPDFIRYMMANPAILDMKKGHIHSHNTMNTFFSGTDTGELVENAPNHNFYVSLIVNNKNENCAMVAFIATEESETQETTIVTQVKFKNGEGEDVSKKFTKKIEATKTESKAIYAYECDIEYPGTVGGTLTARFQQLSEKLRRREEEREKIWKKNNPNVNRYGPNQDFFHGKRDWNQPELFDTHSKTNRGNPKEERGGKNGKTITIPQGLSGKNLLKAITDGVPIYSKKKSGVYSQLPKSTKTEVYSMLSKLLTLDPTSEEHLGSIMNKLNFSFYPAGNRTNDMRISANKYYDDVSDRATSFYSMTFLEDKKRVKYEDTMSAAIEILSTFDTHFPELVENLTEAIKDTFNKESKLFL